MSRSRALCSSSSASAPSVSVTQAYSASGRVQLGHAAGIVDDQHWPGIAVLAQVLLQIRQRVVLRQRLQDASAPASGSRRST